MARIDNPVRGQVKDRHCNGAGNQHCRWDNHALDIGGFSFHKGQANQTERAKNPTKEESKEKGLFLSMVGTETASRFFIEKRVGATLVLNKRSFVHSIV